jgi:hypothetical protein
VALLVSVPALSDSRQGRELRVAVVTATLHYLPPVLGDDAKSFSAIPPSRDEPDPPVGQITLGDALDTDIAAPEQSGNWRTDVSSPPNSEGEDNEFLPRLKPDPSSPPDVSIPNRTWTC